LTDESDRQETQARRIRVPWWASVLVALCAAAVVAWFMWKKTPEETTLHGVLVDMELHTSDLPRYTDLQQALTTRVLAEEDVLRGVTVSLERVHFSALTVEFLASRRVDFMILSPQGTPWYRYTDETAASLESVKRLLRDLVLKQNMPVLGICGGHQFMTLAFGGAVGFIDPRLEGSFPNRYPPDALSERGLTRLQTLRDNPIFTGVATHPGTFAVMESHYEEVKKVPAPFVNIARSDLSEAQLIHIPGKPVYGMAFHPERGWDAARDTDESSTSGRRLLANFLTMVARHKDSGQASSSSSSAAFR
jgi:GMP synthase-like glutamine amidotransferase